ncbi:carnitine dehydratase [beta proteobacterium AAP99]|nr:carnitine dehydratase [beta proteobacterium AAP99]
MPQPADALMSPRAALLQILEALHLPASASARAQLTGAEPVLPSWFACGVAAQASIAAAALAADALGQARSAEPAQVAVDMRAAAVEFRSERYLRVDGATPPDLWDKIAGAYQCGDGRWVRIHTNFPHHRDGVLALLGCEYEKAAVAAALRRWTAEEFETAAAERGLVAAAMRSFAEWDAHPQGQAVAALPLLEITHIGPGRAAPLGQLPAGAAPLAGARVLDLTRVIAGPVAGRTLATYGADVMLITSPGLPSVAPLVIDTGRGKRSAALDLNDAAQRASLQQLAAQADVFLQGYRPGGLAARGFAPEQLAAVLAERRGPDAPGIVAASLSAYGRTGPWANRRGFDSLVQTACGMNDAEARAHLAWQGHPHDDSTGQPDPRPLPAQVLDHASGYLLAAGIAAALARREREGGSWHVEVSLAQTAHWLRGLGRQPAGFAAPDPGQSDVADCLADEASGFGRLTVVRHAARTTPAWPAGARPSVPLGSHPARW